LKNYSSLIEIQKDIREEKISCRNLVRDYLDKISKNEHLNAFIEVYTEEALSQALIIDRKFKNKDAGLLAGLVIGIKDNICYQNHPSSAASKMLENFQSNYSSTVVERLLAEDAIIIGRLNCDEFAMGSSNQNSIFGPVKNPINCDYVPGGSSGGSAAAVRANLCHIALGSDTGGSIRQPAAFCGVMGLKPTYGLVSRHGLIAYASSFDQIGPICKSADDIRLVTHVISGVDNFDTTCIGKKTPLDINKKFSAKSFAVIQDTLEFSGLNKGISKEFNKLIEYLTNQGHTVKYIKLPLLEYLVPTYYILTTAEASSNLSRYDGIKYGLQVSGKDIESLVTNTRTLGFGKEVKRRILLGNFVLSQGYYDEYYQKAQRVRRLIQDKTKDILAENDFILLPTSPNLPFKLGTKEASPTQSYYEDVFTVHANLTGHPAISFPLGEVDNGFYASAQIIGDYFSESDLIQITKQITL
jgi:aspartyl-tRNA(Asn)/glutamyl-tRNA(Gln) amidotransferase subunit A